MKRSALLLPLVALAVHAVTASRYGYFRDELYFIACARHLAWGYVDQPPLVALAAWLATPSGFALLALRAGPILAAAATVALVVEFVAAIGGGAFARWSAGLLTLLLPAYLLLGNTLTTTSFEPLSWTLVIYCTLRLLRSDGAMPWWIATACAVVFGLYGKYSIALLVVALALGVLATPQRRMFLSLRALAALGLTLVLFAPNLLWQGAHGWPILAVLHGDATHRPAFQNGLALQFFRLGPNALAFAVEQLLYTNPLAAPIWIAGIVVPFALARFKELRFLSIAALVTLVAAILLNAKGYYAIGLYGALIGVGSVWLESTPLLARRALLASAIVVALLAMPFSLPALPVNGLIAYAGALHVTGTDGTPPRLVQPVFAEEFGWERLARDVARVYDALPAAQRAKATIYADTYADAGALDFFGPRNGLPPAISSQNSYFLWGMHGARGTVLVAIGATRIDLLRRYYRHVRLVATSFDERRWIVEGPAPIYLCTDPVAPLSAIWPHLRWYGA